ncbi:hypothetical protein CIW48_11715 [Methylobacterium sp. P1-11]|nr:hypothetical protein CIW48_11715 [Methylobacterium sp. P1-11]
MSCETLDAAAEPGRSDPRPHPEVPASAGLEGGFQNSRGRLEASFEAPAGRLHLRMRASVGSPPWIARLAHSSISAASASPNPPSPGSPR